jgi:hypothetical protein
MSSDRPLKAAMLRQYLQGCGYRSSLLLSGFAISENLTVPLAAFAQSPADARSACIAVLDADESSGDLVESFRPLAAPVVFVCTRHGLEWWQQGSDHPKRIGPAVPPIDVPRFFEAHGGDFAPDAVYRAKTWGRFDREFQLSFVDIGLMPLIEGQIGEALQNLILRNVQRLKSLLGWETLSEKQGHWLLKAVFWLVSAKILRDKEVGEFTSIDLLDISHVVTSLAEHYDTQGLDVTSKRQQVALTEIAADVARFSNLQLATTESLAYVYENTLISKATRQALGTHSTPSYLVDYIVGRLAPSIKQTDLAERNVFEPACGHAAFLVSAMRLLTELLPKDQSSPHHRRSYLRKRIHGGDVDTFALEIARLSLSLTDIPNPDGWDLVVGDMFVGNRLETSAREATAFFANPPFENFSAQERTWYKSKGVTLRHVNKAAEMLSRILPELPEGAAVGVVVPQGFLHSKNARDVRKLLTGLFELQEICLFPDKVFTFSDMESAVLIARKHFRTQKDHAVSYRHVRERQFPSFRFDYSATSDRSIDQERFSSDTSYTLRVPDLEEVWACCRHLPTLQEIADVGKGLTYKGEGLPRGALTFSDHRFPGSHKGFVRFESGIMIHELPREYWLSFESSVIDRPRHGTTIGSPQVLVNEAPSSRGPWRLKALLDIDGHPVTARFNVVRPRSGVQQNLPFFWALCNSAFANAFVYSHAGKRHNDAGLLRQMRVPDIARRSCEGVISSASRYLEYVGPGHDALSSPIRPDRARELLLRMENEVLRMYDLPREVEWQLLNFFAGWRRGGIPFTFDRLLPENCTDHLSLADYLAITADWSQTNRRRETLVRKKVAREISTAERSELDHLQFLATSRARLVAPLPLKELEDVHRALVGGSV